MELNNYNQVATEPTPDDQVYSPRVNNEASVRNNDMAQTTLVEPIELRSNQLNNSNTVNCTTEVNQASRKQKKYVLGFLVLFIILGSLAGFLAWFFTRLPDGCGLIGNKLVVDVDEAVVCYRSFDYKSEESNGIIKMIKNAMQYSSTIDFLKENPDPHFTKKIDVLKDLDAIIDQTYKTSFDFHNRLTKYMISLEEVHTTYQSYGYNTFKFQLPFALLPFHQENRVRLKVIEYNMNSNLKSEFIKRGIDINKLKDDFVIEIEGMAPMEYIRQFADKFVGLSRDPNYKIASSLAHVTEYYPNAIIEPGFFAKPSTIPDQLNIKFNFEKYGQMEIPYLAVNPGHFENRDTFHSRYISPQYGIDLKPDEIITEISNPSFQLPIIFSGKFIKIYRVEDAAVISITKLPIDDVSEQSWDEEFPDAMRKLKQTNLQKIIFEMSNNPGGKVNVALELLVYFFPHAKSKLFKNYLTNKKPVIDEFNRALKQTLDSWQLNYKQKSFHRQITSNIDKHINSNEPRISIDLNWGIRDYFYYPESEGSSFQLKSMALISNSICASACTLFSNWIQEMTNSPTYHIGHLIPEPATIGSGIGGSLYLLTNLQSSMLSANLNLAYKDPTLMFITLPLIGFYSNKHPQQSLDFTWFPAQHQINITLGYHFNPETIWRQIANQLPSPGV